MNEFESGELYVPELGQACFGQPWQSFECPDHVVNALRVIGDMIEARDGIDPMQNTGHRFECAAFKAHAYSWDEEEEQSFNFEWSDFHVSWYKYLGRGTTISRQMTLSETSRMLRECLEALDRMPSGEIGP